METVTRPFKSDKDEELGAEEKLRAATRGLGSVVTESVRDGADGIIAQTDDTEMRRRAILWKVRVITDAHEAARMEDPRAGLVDLCVLAYQMAAFFRTGDGRDMFGVHQQIALDATSGLETQADEVLSAILPADKVERASSRMREYAAKHPMQKTFARTPLLTTEVEGAGWGWLPSIGSVVGLSDTAVAIQGATAMGNRFTDVVSTIPESSRWQLELLLLTIVQSERFGEVTGSLERASKAAEDLVETAGEMPVRVREEAERLIAEVDESQAQIQVTLREANTAAEGVRALVGDLDHTAQSIESMAAVLDSTLQTFEAMVRYLQGDEPGTEPEPPADPDDEAHPFNILEFDQTARSITVMAGQLQETLAELRTTVGARELDARISAVETAAQESIDAAGATALRVGLILLGALFGGILLLRLLPSRRASTTSPA